MVWVGIATSIALQVIGPSVGKMVHSASKSDLQGDIASAAVTAVLNSILSGQPEELEQLQAIKADTQALVQGPYRSAMLWIGEAAQPYRTTEERREFIEKAMDKFMEAHGQEQHPFRQALIQFYLGNCWVLLGSNEDARGWFERAHISAMNSLHELGHPVHTAWDTYVKYVGYAAPVNKVWNKGKKYMDAAKKHKIWAAAAGVLAVAAGPALVVYGSPVAAAGGVLKGAEAWAKRSYEKAMEEFVEKSTTVLGLIEALHVLQNQAPPLALEFSESPPTPNTLEEWLRSC